MAEMRTRSQTRDMEVAHILATMRQSPVLKRTLSHQARAYARAMEIAPQTKPGDTILINYFISPTGMTNLEYIQNENNQMVVHRIDAPYESITMKWTYDITEFEF